VDGLFSSLSQIQKRLSAAGIESAAIGALAVAVWGKPRLTTDVDLKINLAREDSQLLLDCLGADYPPLVAGDPAARLRGSGMLFVSDPSTNRIDLLLSDVEFDREVIRRSKEVFVRPDTKVRVCSAEDLVIYKLLSTRARDHEDARHVVIRQAERLDRAYVERWLRDFEAALDDSTLVDMFTDMLSRAR